MLSPASIPSIPLSRVLFKDRSPGAALGGGKGGFRFNDSTGVDRLPRYRLKIESPTSREGRSGTCVARAGSPGAVFAGGWGSSVGIPMARGFQARPATKQRQREGGSASSAHCGTPLAQAPLTPAVCMGGRRGGLLVSCSGEIGSSVTCIRRTARARYFASAPAPDAECDGTARHGTWRGRPRQRLDIGPWFTSVLTGGQ